jgi:polar amino acid transport system ATP-binding protein
MRIEIDGLVKSFGPQRVLDGLNLRAEGRVLVLIGPSGGGKSTLLRLLAGLDAPDAGSVRLDGREMDFREPALLIHRRRMGMVFQSSNLFPHLTARRNITLPLVHVHGMGLPEADARADELLRRFGLDGHAEKTPGQLSGGQKQRVAIVRAVAVRPELLLLDEPTSALDPEMAGEVLDLIAELRAEGRDLVLATHHAAFARAVADTVALVAGGIIAESGTAAAVLDAPESTAGRRYVARLLGV